MYNWQSTIGFMLPSSCLVYEQEFAQITTTLQGVVGVPTRLLITDCDAQGLADMNSHIALAAKQLATCDPDIVVYMCTSGSFMDGDDGEAAIRQQLQKLTGKPVMTTAQAVLAAMKRLHLKSVAMLTPYNENLTVREINWLGKNDVQVIDHRFLDIPNNLDRGARFAEANFNEARRLNWQEADGVFLSCANMRYLEIIAKLEHYTAKPVVTSSAATTWMALRMTGVHEPIEDCGQLLMERL